MTNLSAFVAPGDAPDAISLIAIRTQALDATLATLPPSVQAWARANGFTAKPHTVLTVPRADGRIALALVGMESTEDAFALAHLPFALPEGNYVLSADAGERVCPSSAALGWGLGAYRFTRYCAASRAPARLALDIDALADARAQLEATTLVRELVNTPTQDMGPEQLEATVCALGERHGAAVRTIVGDALLAENLPAIHAVGRASHRAPRLIELRWGDPAHPALSLVGKGVCFDTGGLDMKNSDGMRNMKKDMGGAAHAIALAALVMARGLKVRLQLLVPAVENSIGPDAYRPGEVIATRKGFSVEIDNTDAEGRVVLCDALALAAESDPSLILDFATLTGAARVALGPDVPALFSNDDVLRAEFLDAGMKVNDPVWPMPLWRPYRHYLKSSVADFANAGSRMAGAITAALYLERFVPETTPWVHLDTYAWNDRDRPGRPAGGEAISLRAAWAVLCARYGVAGAGE